MELENYYQREKERIPAIALKASARADVRALFRQRRVPLTRQRRAVYEELAARRDHPSAESLHGALRKQHPSLSLATVYKTLQTLQALGMIARVDSPSAQARYDALTATHHHAVCVGCGDIRDLFAPRLDRLPAPRTPGFLVRGHSVHFHGLCASCARASQSASRQHHRRLHHG